MPNEQTTDAYKRAVKATNTAMSLLIQAAIALDEAMIALRDTGHRGADASTAHAQDELDTLLEHCRNDAGALKALGDGGLCWCGETAEVWNIATDATEAHAACVKHAKDGYMGL